MIEQTEIRERCRTIYLKTLDRALDLLVSIEHNYADLSEIVLQGLDLQARIEDLQVAIQMHSDYDEVLNDSYEALCAKIIYIELKLEGAI